MRTIDDNEENWVVREESPVNKRLHWKVCIMDGCRYCVPRDPDNYFQDFDRICGNEEVCTNCDKFEYSMEDLHKEVVKREMYKEEVMEEVRKAFCKYKCTMEERWECGEKRCVERDYFMDCVEGVYEQRAGKDE